MERLGAREWNRAVTDWRIVFVWILLNVAGRSQGERGRPPGALGASVEVALDRMLLSLVTVLTIIACICYFRRRFEVWRTADGTSVLA